MGEDGDRRSRVAQCRPPNPSHPSSAILPGTGRMMQVVGATPEGMQMAHPWDWPAEEDRSAPPMPAKVVVHATVRNDEPVARLEMTDVTGDIRIVDLSPETALDLLVKLGRFVRQTGARGMQ